MSSECNFFLRSLVCYCFDLFFLCCCFDLFFFDLYSGWWVSCSFCYRLRLLISHWFICTYFSRCLCSCLSMFSLILCFLQFGSNWAKKIGFSTDKIPYDFWLSKKKYTEMNTTSALISAPCSLCGYVNFFVFTLVKGENKRNKIREYLEERHSHLSLHRLLHQRIVCKKTNNTFHG